jgi:hypothetical protein
VAAGIKKLEPVPVPIEDGRFMAVDRPILARCAFRIGPGKRLE